jgi:hypothetical protein
MGAVWPDGSAAHRVLPEERKRVNANIKTLFFILDTSCTFYSSPGMGPEENIGSLVKN